GIGAHPRLFDVTVAIFEPDRVLRQIIADGLEIAGVRRACPLLALTVDEQLAKIPFPIADFGNRGLPQAGFAFDLLPTTDSAAARQNRLLVPICSDGERLIGVRTGIFRRQYYGLRAGIGAAAQQNRN